MKCHLALFPHIFCTRMLSRYWGGGGGGGGGKANNNCSLRLNIWRETYKSFNNYDFSAEMTCINYL